MALWNAASNGCGEFIAMDVLGLLCGMLFWAVVILAWIAYLMHGKPSKPVRYVGTGILAALVSALGLLFFRGLHIEEAQREFLDVARHGDTAEVERRIQGGANVNYVQDDTNYTPLIVAASGNYTDTVAAILRHHPTNLNQRDMQNETALHIAKEQGNQEMIRLLKAAGAKE
jgi:hypothetical protein